MTRVTVSHHHMSHGTMRSVLSETQVRWRAIRIRKSTADKIIAKNQFASNPRNTIYDIKRLIGRKFSDKDVQRDMKHFPFKVVNKSGQPKVEVDIKG